jgi:hypothetical protein
VEGGAKRRDLVSVGGASGFEVRPD